MQEKFSIPLEEDALDKVWGNSYRSLPDLGRRFYNYLLLNGSFSDHIGLIDGKGACCLYLYCVSRQSKDPLEESIAFTFLDELVSSLHKGYPVHFDDGLAGIGILLEYLSNQKIISEDTNELLKDIEPYILGYIYQTEHKEVNISKGVSGLGLYCLSRLFSSTPPQGFQQLRLREAVIACVDGIERMLAAKTSFTPADDLSILDGYAGVLLFLDRIEDLGWHQPLSNRLAIRIKAMLTASLQQEGDIWHSLETYFVLFKCGWPTAAEQEAGVRRLTQFISNTRESDLLSIDPLKAAAIAMWAGMIYMFYPAPEFPLIRDTLRQSVKDKLSNHHLGDLFPLSQEQRAVKLDLRKGLLATAMPWFTLESGDHSWLNIFGIQSQPHD